MKKRCIIPVLLTVSCLMTACGGGNSALSSVSANEVEQTVKSLMDNIDPAQYIELGKYKGLEVTRLSTKVTEEDIEAEINDNIGAFLEAEEVTGRDTVENGDIVNIDFVGKIDGEAFDGGSSQGFDLTIGSGMFIDGFEQGLIGARVGDKLDLDLTFPENYGNDGSLSGKPVVFEVSVNSIKQKPKITDEAVKKATDGEYSSIKEYRKYIKETLEKNAVQYADSAMYIDLWNQVVENSELKTDIPDEIIQDKLETIKKNAETYATAYGMDWDTYLSQAMGITEDEFLKEAGEYARQGAKESLVLAALAKAEGLELDQDEINKAMKDYVQMYNYESVQDFMNKENMAEFKEYVLMSKVQEFLAKEAVIKTED